MTIHYTSLTDFQLSGLVEGDIINVAKIRSGKWKDLQTGDIVVVNHKTLEVFKTIVLSSKVYFGKACYDLVNVDDVPRLYMMSDDLMNYYYSSIDVPRDGVVSFRLKKLV
jgi:hypothetical protein